MHDAPKRKTMLEVPDAVAAFRLRYRDAHIGPRYDGRLHIAFTSIGALTAIVVAASRVVAPSALELLAVPASFLIANVGEYFGHRGPMHHRRRGFGVLFERHTRQHHRFYTHEAMAAESPRDFHMVLFPPVMLLFFLGALAAPLGLALGALFSPNVGWLFGATAVSYFLIYEWLHFAYHLPKDGFIGRLGLVRRLRHHHTAHHDPSLMTRYNFNITFPIADRLFGTLLGPTDDAR
jgi:sterol desaturase/sphingolipid hydroxylase (fatty acid hydroxylase superfamily)